jgi:transposase
MEKFVAKLKADKKFSDRPSCFVIDNASYHGTNFTKAVFARLGVTMAFTAPYSWSTSACELFFAALKSTNLIPQSKPAGKR